MARSFAIDVEKCPGCGCKMKLCRLVTGRDLIVELLTDLGEPIDPPPRTPARDPPYFQSRTLRRRFGEPREPREPREPGEPEEQLDLFD
jgi:hypothetical protein